VKLNLRKADLIDARPSSVLVKKHCFCLIRSAGFLFEILQSNRFAIHFKARSFFSALSGWHIFKRSCIAIKDEISRSYQAEKIPKAIRTE